MRACVHAAMCISTSTYLFFHQLSFPTVNYLRSLQTDKVEAFGKHTPGRPL